MPSIAWICLRAAVPTCSTSALVADDDALLRRAFDEQVRVDVEQRLVVGAALAQAHLLDDDGDRVRQLVAHALQGGLADQLGDDRLLGRVREVAIGVERRASGICATSRSASSET